MPRLVSCLVALACALLLVHPSIAQTETPPEPKAAPAKKPKPPPKPTVAQLRKQVEEQKALLEAQVAQIADLQSRLETQLAEQTMQGAALEEHRQQVAALQAQLDALIARLQEIQQQIPGLEAQKALEERLKQLEESSEQIPELAANVVSAGNFPGSIRIPGTDAAVKFGGRIRTAAVFTLDDLGSDDRFVTNTIPVESGDEAVGIGRRTKFTANTSRFNFEMRTPTGAGQLRTFIEGDFFGSNEDGNNINFRLRHAFAQFRGLLVGQTWSTFSDPAADHQDLDFEGINGENVIRQAQIRYTWAMKKNLSMAVALETPEVSITGGEGVNVAPDAVARTIWSFKEIGHLQGAVVLRQIRGEPDTGTEGAQSEFAWGASLSGVVPFYYFNLTDRFIFQINFGEGNARYINDLNSLGGQDAVFNPLTGELVPLKTVGWYLDYEHQWKAWERTRSMKLRSSFIWSFVQVDNLDFQVGPAYKKTSRYSVNLVFSPTPRIDCGVEYIYGTRENFDGLKGSADQVQVVGIFRF